MNTKFDGKTRDYIRILSISGIIIVSVAFLFQYIGPIMGFFGKIFNALTPFFIGFFLALILVPLRRIVEKRWLKDVNLKEKSKRKLSVAISVVIFFLVIAVFFMILIPQLVASANTLIASMDGYMKVVEQFISQFDFEGDLGRIVQRVLQSLEQAVTNWTTGQSGIIPRIVDYSVSFVSSIFNFFIGVIIAIYLMIDQEKFRNQVYRVILALFGTSAAKRARYVGKLSEKMFNSFVFGKALDSFVIGIICWICTTILRIPYAPLISFVIGITNMIPVFGPFIGAIPSIFILLIINPTKALVFLVFIVILQQIDGNILGPYILGESLGLPAIWIMFAIIVGGKLFGVLGMFLGVPVFSVIYYLAKDALHERLGEPNLIEPPKKTE